MLGHQSYTRNPTLELLEVQSLTLFRIHSGPMSNPPILMNIILDDVFVNIEICGMSRR